MSILGIVAFATIHAQAGVPVLWLAPNGNLEVAGRAVQARMTAGVRQIRLANGMIYDFNGTRGGILIPDLPEMKLTGSITVSVWVNLRSYVTDGPGAQIFFRGDDRCGVDPYSLVIHPDGTIHFGIQDGEDKGWNAGSEIPLHKWIRVVGNIDKNTGEMNLWLGNEQVAYSRTSRRSFAELDKAWAPGLGIGNVQNDKGPHNQPFNGMIADLRVYDRPYRPEDIEQTFSPWDNPPDSRRHTVQ